MKKTLEKTLALDFPELKIEIKSIPTTSDIKEDEILGSIKYIRENKLVEDSRNLLSNRDTMRSSITYTIITKNKKRDLNFEVSLIQGPMVYIGVIKDNNDNNLLRFYGMRLRDIE